jgi:predicted permease
VTAIARLIIRLSARLAPKSDRARLTEEWLAELDVAAGRGAGAALRFALGAPKDALAHRRAKREGSRALRPPMRPFAALTTDLRYAIRQLLRRPAYTLAVVGCLVVGLVASVGMFSFITSIFYGDMPGIAQRRELLRVYLSYDHAAAFETTAKGGVIVQRAAESLSLSDFAEVRDVGDLPAIDVIGAEGNILPITAAGNHGPISVDGAFASGDFFRALRTVPQVGRLFSRDDDRSDARPVAVVADNFWRTQLDGRADAIGRPILVSGLSFTVIGVAPPRFHGMRTLDLGEDDSHGVQVWIPLAHAPLWPAQPADDPWLSTVARLTPGSTIGHAEQQLAVAAARIAAANPSGRSGAAPFVRTMGLGPTSSFRILILVGAMLALPMIILAIGCANVANLQLARAAEQSRELAVRLALGATRTQLARMLTFETLARVLIAVAASIGLVALLLRTLAPLFPVFITIDWRVVLFALGLAVGVALVTGLMPAWLVLRSTAAGQLKQSAQSGGLGHSRLRGGLVVSQVAMSLALLVLAGLFMRTAQSMVADAPAVLREQLVATFDPTELRMSGTAARTFADTVVARIGQDPRATGVSLATERAVRITSPASAASTELLAPDLGITPSWLDVMQVRVLAGRRLNAHDDASVVMISAHAAELVAPDGAPLGKMLRLVAPNAPERNVMVVGVVADRPMRPTVDRPGPVVYSMFPAQVTAPFSLPRRPPNTDALQPHMMRLISAIDPQIAWTSIRRGDMSFQDDAQEMQYGVLGAGAAALIALVLSATGLYAVMSYVVQLRRREIGVRVAIGAEPGRIVALMLRQALRLVGAGIGCGLAVSVPMAFFLRANMVARVTALDPAVFIPTAVLLLGVGAIASIVPSLRASRVDPISTLRQD